jgi:Protein of unknown function (DUF1761)
MPKLAGVNVAAVLAAAVAMFLVGFLFYGLLFDQVFMQARGYTEEEMQADASPMWMVGGFLIELTLAFGIGWMLLKSGAKTLAGAAGFGLALAAMIGFPLLAYNYTYSLEHSVPGLLVDWAHIAVSFATGAVIIRALSGARSPA